MNQLSKFARAVVDELVDAEVIDCGWFVLSDDMLYSSGGTVNQKNGHAGLEEGGTDSGMMIHHLERVEIGSAKGFRWTGEG